jgi:hypothetical protein
MIFGGIPVRSELSEFSYGFAVTAELRDAFWPRIVEAPLFPTLRAEARLGWDVKFPIVGRAIFIQFKVAEALTRATAAEWARYLSEYYRFPMHRLSHSDQHNRLRNLALHEPFVFYVSPRFYRLVEFNGYYRGATVSQESVWIPVSSLPLISDNLQHHVTYRTGSDVRFASPESQPIDKTFDGEGLKVYITKELQTQKKEMELASFNQLRTELLDILKEGKMQYFPELPIRADNAQQIFKDITYLSRTFFGAEFLLVHEP